MLNDSIAEHRSKPPLRWIANWAGSIGSYGLLEISYLQDEGKTNTFKYKLYGFLWDTFWPIYQKYGTFYKFDMDMSGEGWNDYDDKGNAYWDYEWHVDAKTGDAWRLVKKESGYFGGRWWDDDDFRITPFFGENR
jgi:hypothetical protein